MSTQVHRFSGRQCYSHAMIHMIYAHATALPIYYPRAVQMEYRVADAAGLATGTSYQDEAQPWIAICRRFVCDREVLEAFEALLRKGERAYIGLWHVRLRVDGFLQ